MPYSAGRSAGGGENVNHFAGYRVRVQGNCNLIGIWHALDQSTTKQMAPITINGNPKREPFRLGGFTSQRAALELMTVNIGETFLIERIVIFAKPLWTGYSGG